jgi:hypothetical protein
LSRAKKKGRSFSILWIERKKDYLIEEEEDEREEKEIHRDCLLMHFI